MAGTPQGEVQPIVCVEYLQYKEDGDGDLSRCVERVGVASLSREITERQPEQVELRKSAIAFRFHTEYSVTLPIPQQGGKTDRFVALGEYDTDFEGIFYYGPFLYSREEVDQLPHLASVKEALAKKQYDFALITLENQIVPIRGKSPKFISTRKA